MRVLTKRILSSCVRVIVGACCAVALAMAQGTNRFTGSAACATCHAMQYAAQSSTGHAHALARAPQIIGCDPPYPLPPPKRGALLSSASASRA